MNITGFTKRSISKQLDIVSYNFDFIPFSGFGSGEFGISGSNVFKYVISNGKIFDTSGKFISSYSPGEITNISGQLSQTTFDAYINNELIELGQPINTGYYNYIFANTNNSFDLSASIRGSIPNYTLPESGAYISSGAIITGNIINLTPNNAFRIFDAYVDQVGAPYFITGFTTGDIINTGNIRITSSDEQNSDYLLPIVLNTNFGDIPFSYFISGNQVLGLDTYLSISPDIVEIISPNRQNYTTYFSSFPNQPGIAITLTYLSGQTGNIYDLVTASKTGQTGLLTGNVSGITTFSDFRSGIVSGLDPKTLIVETGWGSGYLYSSPVTGTGIVTINYVETIYGYGTGNVTTDYLASGYTALNYSGNVNLTGSYLNGLAYNFLGTGNDPGIATGIVPLGTGLVLVRPTGIFLLSSALSGSDYTVGNLSVAKIFEGWLYYNYNLTGLGYATGQSITGVVTSKFTLDFEPAYYTFTKYFSGAVLGFGTNTGNFNPVICLNAAEELSTSGLLTGYFSWSGGLDCDALNTLPRISISGYPDLVYQTGALFASNKVVTVAPSGGFSTNENSVYKLNNTTRTTISNPNTGYFSGLFDNCGSLNGIWRERIVNSTNVTGVDATFYSATNALSELNFEYYTTGSGNIGLFSPRNIIDSGSMKFTITGSGSKLYGLRGLSDSIGGPKGLSLYLFKEATLIGIFDSYLGGIDLRMYNKSLSSFYDVGGLFELNSGNYTIISLTQQLEEPTIQFSQAIFSGCETDRYLRFEVTRSGDLRSPSSVDIIHYNENISTLNAHSGVNYYPVTGTIRWGVLQGFPQYFDVPIYDNGAVGNDHFFSIEMSNISNATYGTQSIATGQIICDERATVFITGEFSGNAITGKVSGINPEFCTPITSPIFFSGSGDNNDPSIGIYNYESNTGTPTKSCYCPLPNTGIMSPTSGSGLLPGQTGLSSGLVCFNYCTNGTEAITNYKYLGQACSNTCYISTKFTSTPAPPEVEGKPLIIPICSFPSGFLVVDQEYNFSPVPTNFKSGEKASCCPVGIFLKVINRTTGPVVWDFCASGIAALGTL